MELTSKKPLLPEDITIWQRTSIQTRWTKYIRKYGLPEKLIGNNALAHSKVGAEILEHEFGVTDREILDSVRYHTTARKDMTLLEEVIFVADVVEDNRTYSDLDYYQDLAYRDLDRACLEILEYTIGTLPQRAG